MNYIREYNINHGVPKAQAYNVTMYIMAALFVIGFICQLPIKAVHARYLHEIRGRECFGRLRRKRQRILLLA